MSAVLNLEEDWAQFFALYRPMGQHRSRSRNRSIIISISISISFTWLETLSGFETESNYPSIKQRPARGQPCMMPENMQ